MEKRTKRILDEALQLPEPERAELVEILASTLEEDIYHMEMHPDWGPEIERRMRDYREGRTKGMPWKEVKEEIHREVFGD
jgi:putative addiction module component (TIGR02574 family)